MYNHFYNRPHSDVAIVYENCEYSVGSILKLSQSIGHKLYSPNLTCLISTENPVIFLAALIACWNKQCCIIPLKVSDEGDESNIFPYQLSDIKITHDSIRVYSVVKLKQPLAKVKIKLGDAILFTTGSSGKPKGVVLTANQLMLNAYLAGHSIGLNASIRWAIETDLALTSGLCHLLMAWMMRAPLYYLRGSSVQVKKDFFSSFKVGYGGSPVQIVRLSEELPSQCSPKHIMSSGDFLTEAMLLKIRRNFTQSRVHKFYGLTELSGRFCVMPSDFLDKHPDSVGMPLPGFDVELRDEEGKVCDTDKSGTVYVRSPLVMQGYVINGEFIQQTRSEWFCTNDIATLDKNNLFYLQGRTNDSFKVGGEKVDRFTIENALGSLLADFEFCVLPKKHDLLGFVPALYIAKHGTRVIPSRQIILNHLSEKLPPRYLPMHLIVLPDLPRMQNGKLNREEIASCCGEDLSW